MIFKRDSQREFNSILIMESEKSMSLKFQSDKIDAGATQGKTSGIKNKLHEFIFKETEANFTVIKNEDSSLSFESSEIGNLGIRKRELYNLPNNPFDLENPAHHTNAKVHRILLNMSVKTHTFDDGVEERLLAKKVYKGNRYEVIYLSRKAYEKKVAEYQQAKDKDAVKMCLSKWESIKKLEDAYKV